MKEKTQVSEYKGIFKSTLLFGFVQVFKAVIGVVKNKVVAILLGAEGMGMIGIYNSTMQMLQTGAGLGISQSAVRDISEANGSNDRALSSKIITVTMKVALYTSLLGLVVTIALSPWLSEWTMGSRNYTLAFAFLGLVVAFNIISQGQLAILKGMRQLRYLAKASMIGAVVGLTTAVPLYYYLGRDGIIPALILTGVSSVVFSYYYVRKIDYDKIVLLRKDFFKTATPMVKMGVALMFVTFLSSAAALIIASYIRSLGGLTDVGYYSAGMAITNSYFGVIITALTTDYYPRIASVNKNNIKIQEELNRQSAVSLVLTSPLIVLFLVLLPWFVFILYSQDFAPTISYLKYAIYGTLITICSNQIDMILVAKFEIKIFTIIAIIYRIIQVVLSVYLYKYFGLVGMGIAIAILGMIHMLIMLIVVYRMYGITYNIFFVKLSIIVLIFTIGASLISELNNEILKLILGFVLVLGSSIFSLFISKKYFNLDFIKMLLIKLKIKK